MFNRSNDLTSEGMFEAVLSQTNTMHNS